MVILLGLAGSSRACSIPCPSGYRCSGSWCVPSGPPPPATPRPPFFHCPWTKNATFCMETAGCAYDCCNRQCVSPSWTYILPDCTATAQGSCERVCPSTSCDRCVMFGRSSYLCGYCPSGGAKNNLSGTDRNCIYKFDELGNYRNCFDGTQVINSNFQCTRLEASLHPSQPSHAYYYWLLFLTIGCAFFAAAFTSAIIIPVLRQELHRHRNPPQPQGGQSRPRPSVRPDGYGIVRWGMEAAPQQTSRSVNAMSFASEAVCQVCFAASAHVAFLPCMHAYLCQECASSLRAVNLEIRCPFCRTVVTSMFNLDVVRPR
jgi:hypothetical protein